MDPLAEKYIGISSYAYVANNPLIFVDPDGRDIRLAAGLTNEEKLKIVGNLQSITNDKIVYSTLDDGTAQVKIVSLGTENSSRDLKYGTNLIRTLNKKGPDEHVVTIDITTGGNQISGRVTNANINSDGTANTGESSTVLFNPESTQGGYNEEGNRDRPSFIGLGHELIHAKNRYTGTRVPSSSGKNDPDGSGTILSNEELNTRAGENKIRQEQGLPLRRQP